MGYLLILHPLELVADPVALLSVWNMHELNSDFLAIGILIGSDEILEFPVLLLSEQSSEFWCIDIELSLQVSLSEAVRFIVQKGFQLACGRGS